MRHPLLLASLICLGGLPLVRAADPETPGHSTTSPDWIRQKLAAAEGAERSLQSEFGERGCVLVFLSTECPISNGYIPALNRLAGEFAPRGIPVVGLNSNSGQSRRELQRHVTDFQVEFPVFKDSGGTIAKELQATICPEVVLLDTQQSVVYRGRIDDRYTKRGGASRTVGRADLELAIQQHLAGQSIETPRTRPVGCPIDFPRDTPQSADSSSDGAVAAPTYHPEISRLLQTHCQECHRPGGIGPFTLLDYDDAVRWSDDLVTFTKSRAMPPWKPTPGFGDFAQSRHMPAADIELIERWVQGGCLEGDRSQAIPPREFRNDWKLGREPDVIFEAPEYLLAADGPDEYRCFVIPTRYDGDRYVSAIEVRPGNPRVVHHVISFLDVSGTARKLDERHEGPGYLTSAGFPGFLPSGGLGGWAPGNQPRELPAGMARLLPQGADIALQVHYHRSGRPETDKTQIGVYFSRGPVERCVRNVPVLPLEGPLGDLEIPANHEAFEVRSSLVLPIDMQAVAVTPHMHLLGKDMTVIATLPDGTVQRLIQITNWDFNWQESYQFREPLLLPRLTRIEVVAHFDNSAGNPHNPRNPPVPVRWGESTDEEMCIAFVEMAPARPEQASLKAPTRRDQLKFFLESQLLDTRRPRLEQARLLKRFASRIAAAEAAGGSDPFAGPEDSANSP